MDRSPDQNDVARALAGDPAGFEGIVHRWQGPLVTLAFRLCRDRDLAEDLAQIAFCRACDRLGSWRGEGAFGSWLVRLAMNVYRSELRRWRPPERALELVPEPVAGEDGDREGVLDDAVRRALVALPMRYREALVMYYFEGADVVRAAAALGIREGTMKARLARGRGQLRRLLEARGLEP